MKSSSSAPAPDPKIGEAALLQAQTGQDWMNFAKDAFAVSEERLAELDAFSKDIANRQLELANNQFDYTKDVTDRQLGLAEDVTKQQLEDAKWLSDVAKQDRARYEKTFKPVEDAFVREASAYGSQERQDAAAAEARADVQSAATSARQSAQREAASMGINPASGRFQGINRSAELGTALATAGAENQARTAQRDKGLALKADVANMGRGLPAQAAQSVGLGVNAAGAAAGGYGQAGNAAIANMGGATGLGINTLGSGLNSKMGNHAAYLQSTGIMNAGFQGGMAGYGGMADTLNRQYSTQVAAWDAENRANGAGAGGIGSFLGGLVGFAMKSDKNLKEDKKPIEEGKALDAVNSMPVEEWTYKEGVEDEGRHVGTYAQDFAAATGKGDGRTIAVQDAIGITMKAVQDLDAKVDKVAAAVGIGQQQPKPRRPQPGQARAPELGLAA